MFVIILFSFIYYLYNCFIKGTPISIKEFFKLIYQKNITSAFWYLYSYLGILVMLPLIRKMISTFTNRDYLYAFGLWGIFYATIPVINHYFNFTKYSGYFSLPIVGGYTIYFIMGYYIDSIIDKEAINRKIASFMWILGIGAIVVSIILSYKDYNLNPKSYLFMDNRIFITTAIPSIACFYLCKYYFMNYSGGRWIRAIASWTFGIYLVSDLLIVTFKFIYTHLINFTHPMVAVVVFELAVFMAGAVITMILKRIPGIRQLV